MSEIINILNTIHANGTADYQKYVPIATAANIDAVANPILNYDPVKNEFVTTMLNKIVMTVLHSKILVNPLAPLKKGSMLMGNTAEELFVNRAKAGTHDPNGSTLLARNKPDVKVAYHSINREDTYPISISDDQLTRAFKSYEALRSMVNGIIRALYNADSDDEFILMKSLMSDAVIAGHIVTMEVPDFTSETNAVAEVETLTVTAAVTADGNVTVTLDGAAKIIAVTTAATTPTAVATLIRAATFPGWVTSGTGVSVIFTSSTLGSKADPKFLPGTTGAAGTFVTTTQGVRPITYSANALTSIVGSFKNVSSYMSFAGSQFNRWAAVNSDAEPIRTRTDRADQVLIIRSDLKNAIDLNVLAAAFNMDKADFLARQVEVDNFGADSDIVAFICDKDFFQVYDKLRKITSFMNPQGLYTNYYLHVWQVMSYSLMVNAAAFKLA